MAAQTHPQTLVPTDLGAYYRENGYVIAEGLVPARQIDALLERYRTDILPSKAKFYRQNTNVYDTNRFTPAGHVIQSFLDIHNYKRFPDFRKAAMDLYLSREMLSALAQVTGHERHNLMQTMLFDANAATPPHQDWWYLDSVPNGNLLGAWIALEDIHEDAGRFYVMPRTQEVVLHRENMPHSEWHAAVKRYFDEHVAEVHAPALKKGDVLFWNSRTIHGAFPTRNPAFSRKSLTGHYMPSHMTYGNLFTSKPWVKYEEYQGHKYFANQPEHSLKAEWTSRIKDAIYDSPRLLKFARKFQKKSLAEV